jgi:hypothetical protein
MRYRLSIAFVVIALGLGGCGREDRAVETTGAGTEEASESMLREAGPGGTPGIPDATSEPKVVPPGVVIPPGEIAPLDVGKEESSQAAPGPGAGANAR